MKFNSCRIPHAVVIGLTGSFVLACSTLLFLPPAAYAVGLDSQGTGGGYKIDCPATDIDLVDFAYAEGKTTYTFSGHCSQTTNNEALPNFPYTIKGSWSQVGNVATEVITSTYGSYSKSGLCGYDPWLDPTVACQTSPASISNNSEVMTHLKAKLDKDYYFPNSKGPFEVYRTGVLTKLLNQSLQIVQPQQNKTYEFPGQFTARVTTGRLVSPAIFPKNLIAILQIDEMPQWPDPSKPASSPRSFTLLNTVENPGGNLYPRAEFPTGTTDLWDGGWLAKAHLLVADPFWTPAVTFFVESSDRLGAPPEQVQPTVLSEISQLSKHMSTTRLFIMSPQTGQSVLGDVTLKIGLWGYPEATATKGPEITLDWTRKPFTKPNAPPPLPIPMEVRSKMHGTELVIPRSAFKGDGIWSVTATIKDSENKPIFDQVTFKIRELSDAVGQVHLNSSAHAKIKPTAMLSTEKEQIKPPTSKTSTLPQKKLKAAEKPEPKAPANAIALQQQAAPQALAAMKTAPTIIRPQENQRFDKPGPVQISARVSAADAGLLWEVEYQAFNAPSFVSQRQPSTGSLAAGGGTIKMARLSFPAPGTYRLRAKEDGDQARWSTWRTIVVGSPPALAPAARNIQLSTKPQLQSDAVKAAPMTEEAPAAVPIRQVPTVVKPTAIKPNALPKIKPLP